MSQRIKTGYIPFSGSQEILLNNMINDPKIKHIDQIVLLPSQDGIMVYLLFEVA